MQASIERIIANDKKARNAVAMAEKYRIEAEKRLREKEDITVKKLNDKLQRKINDAATAAERNKNKITEERKKTTDMVCAGMERLYSEKKDEWIKSVFEDVING